MTFNVAKGTEYQGSIYDAAPTFESYGVPHGSSGNVRDCGFCVLVWIWECENFDIFLAADMQT